MRTSTARRRPRPAEPLCAAPDRRGMDRAARRLGAGLGLMLAAAALGDCGVLPLWGMAAGLAAGLALLALAAKEAQGWS